MNNICPEAEIEIMNFETMLPNGGWKGSAKINGKLFTGEFSPSDYYTIGEDEIHVVWSWFLQNI